ncbi:hypothetical protein WUBG_05105 [Wuchereria bancrofti]|uniref:Uncharacterized protein n=1 Tax=Wuchereria bancrofti TaxID=6293 RepID=J9EP50_WUCBA|nr:hypothetical protein WUBG_05105 [Wuchereria bancrofti]
MNNFVGGMSNGAAFANSLARGFSVGIAEITQQLPQEIASTAGTLLTTVLLLLPEIDIELLQQSLRKNEILFTTTTTS